MRAQRRIPIAALVLLLGALALPAATDYHALLIRSLDPPDVILLEKVKLNDKKKLYRMAQAGPLSKSQYKKLSKISFAEVQWLRIENGHLRLRTESGEERLALPTNFKRWPKGSLETADVVRGSTLKGRDAGSKRKFSALLADGWIVYLFPQRPAADALAFALAEAQGSEQAWVDFLQRFPTSTYARGPRERLATLYAERAREQVSRFEQALEQKRPGYAGLEEARLWLQRARALNLVTDELQEMNTAVAQREAEVRARLVQARALLQEARFPEAEEQLAPWLHFREELPELATLYEDLLTQASAHHLQQARERLRQQQFDQAVQELERATRYRARPEIERLREEITVARAAYQQQQQILAALEAARAAAERGNVARAFETLYPLARQHSEESTLQQEFASIQSSYRQHLLAQAPQVERLHVPIKGPADEEALLKTQRALARLSQVESSTELAVWRDGLGAHLAAYYRQRARTLAGRAGAAFPALSYAYLQQARGFVLDQAGLAELEPYRHRLEEALRIRLALDFRDVTPGAGGEYLIAELRALTSSAVQEAGFPHLDVVEAR
ncbi:MAG: hypothetical protein ACE5HB_03125, partial [Terriglobia bacterium]